METVVCVRVLAGQTNSCLPDEFPGAVWGAKVEQKCGAFEQQEAEPLFSLGQIGRPKERAALAVWVPVWRVVGLRSGWQLAGWLAGGGLSGAASEFVDEN